MTGFVAAVALAAPACGSSSGTAGTGGSGGTTGSGTGGSTGTGTGGSKGTGTGGSKGTGTGGSAGTGSGGTAGSPSDGGMCKNEPDAAGEKLLPVACVTCLAANCGAQLDTCLCDPMCVDVIKCTDTCVLKGGDTTTCALGCAGKADAGPAGEAESLLLCLKSNCTGDGAAGTNPCSAPATTDAATDAKTDGKKM